MGKRILIAGGTGLIGSSLCDLLQEKGYEVAILSRSPEVKNYQTFQWDVERHYLDESALDFAEGLVFLSGENVGAKRWTQKQKDRILNSRIQAIRMLVEKIEKANRKPAFFISASATGFYGGTLSKRFSIETDLPGGDFLAAVTRQWEESVKPLQEMGIRMVVLRTGVVLSEKSGALPKMAKPVQLGLGSALGSGKQYISWIELNDLARLYLFAIENEKLQGVYNAVSPDPVTNETFMRQLARAYRKPFFLPSVPSFLLKLLMGEMADMVLKGNRVSCEKIREAGFSFQYNKLEDYFQNLKQQPH
ncbi:MAG: TIGR01777 family oxidoreductase [Bacteroidales bacterium]|nr:TIGR01777 family oxidoreductase [Bacteroidales bacterium]